MPGACESARAAGPGATMLLSRADIQSLMSRRAYLDAVEAGFRAAAAGDAHAPRPMAIAGSDGTFHAKGASLRLDRLYVALKLNGNFPGNPARFGLPTVQGILLLCDGETGAPLAIMDSVEITLRRTAAATAVAARYLSRADARAILVCGCGEQGRAHLEALRDVLPLTHGFAWDRDPAKAGSLAREAGALGMAVTRVSDLAEAVPHSDVIVACTSSRTAYLGPSHVRPGTFVAAVGADSPEKSEIEPELVRRARVVVDVLDQCVEFGDLRHAMAAGAMRRGDVHADLMELIAGSRQGRSSEAEITLFDSTGAAIEDVAAAAFIYREARRRGGFGSVAMGAGS